MLNLSEITTLIRVAQEMANDAGVPMYLSPDGDSLRITRDASGCYEKFNPVPDYYIREECF